MKRALLIALALVATAGFTALGIWQVERLAWKRALIEQVEARIHALPAPLPPATADAKAAQYTRVAATGIFLRGRDTLTQALTEHGAGYWVLTPLRTAQGIVLVNRGFVPSASAPPPPQGQVRITGLLRAAEPGGGFLRTNDPAADRWYSRDVAAIAQARNLGFILPYFIDADATPNPGGYPIGGLTMVRFSNNHLVYALTWFALAAMSLAAAVLAVRQPRPPRSP